jgi:phospholipid/cholesterol/gamma-HCH transport system substrate-binding protein
MEAGTGQRVTKIPPRLQHRVSPVRAGLIAIVLLVVATFLAFSKSLPWRQPFEFKAAFESAANIRLDSPVRIAGVEVGTVTKVDHMGNADLAVVTMEIKDQGLPIHQDATLKIRPRLFLEGNFFIDMTAGTPGRPVIHDGDTIPVTQTSYPVQLDQILTSLQTDSRKDLQKLLEGFGTGLTHKPSAAEDVTQDRDVRGKTAAQALNDSLTYAPGSLQNGARVNNAFLGTESHDLRKLVAGLQKTLGALGQNEEQLKSFFHNFNITMAALASQEANLRTAVRLLGPTIEKASSYFANFAEALPPTTEFVRRFIPVVRETPATIDAAGPFLTQFTALVSRNELGGLLRDLRPMTASFAKVVSKSVDFNRQTDALSRCFSDVVLPAGDVVLNDGSSSSGVPNYKEFWYSVVGFAGESQNFDGNGQYTRVQTGGGSNVVKSGKLPNRPAPDATLFGNSIATPLGTRPTRPSKKPPYKPNVPCYKNLKPDLNGPAAAAGPPDALVTP